MRAYGIPNRTEPLERRVSGAPSFFPPTSVQADLESYGSDTAQGPLAVVRDVLAVAKKLMYGMYMQYMDDLREGMREVR